MPAKVAVLNRRGPLFVPVATTGSSPEIAGSYPDYDPRLSGFLLGPEHVQNSGSVVVQPYGEGRLVLFSYLPQFRAMTNSTYKQIFNVFLWATEK